MGSVQSLVLTFFHIVLTVDKNKGDIKRNVCMDSVELGMVDGHLSRKMTIAQRKIYCNTRRTKAPECYPNSHLWKGTARSWSQRCASNCISIMHHTMF